MNSDILAVILPCFQTVQENFYETPSPYQAPAKEEKGLYAQITSYRIKIIPRDEIQQVFKYTLC